MRRAAWVSAAVAVLVVVAGSVAVARLVGTGSTHGGTTGALTHDYTYGGPTAGQITLDPPGANAQPKIAVGAALPGITHPFWSPPLTGGPVLLGLARLASATSSGLIAPAPPPGSPRPTAPPSLLPVYPHYYFAVLVDATTGTRQAWTENTSNVAINDCLKAAQ